MTTTEIETIKKLAKEQAMDSQFKLGQMYAMGVENLKKDIDKSLFWYQKAASLGHKGAQVVLGRI